MICCCMPSSWSPNSASSTGHRRRSWRSTASVAAPRRIWARLSALDVHLSSTDRGDSTVQDVMARNEVSLLQSLYAYQVLHGLQRLRESRTHQGWSLIRMREQVLKVAATLSLHARRITGDATDKWWPTLLKGLPRRTALA